MTTAAAEFPDTRVIVPAPKRGPHRIRSVRNKTPMTLAESVEKFAEGHPESLSATFLPLYIGALTCAHLVDQDPSAALIREYNIALLRLRRAVIPATRDEGDDLAGLM